MILYPFKVCQSGECKDSICLKYGLVSCFLTSETVKDKRQLCELGKKKHINLNLKCSLIIRLNGFSLVLACQKPGINGTCMSTKDLVKNYWIIDANCTFC